MANRMPACMGLSHAQIWQEFCKAYPEIDERVLREIHLRWTRAYAEVAGSKETPR